MGRTLEAGEKGIHKFLFIFAEIILYADLKEILING